MVLAVLCGSSISKKRLGRRSRNKAAQLITFLGSINGKHYRCIGFSAVVTEPDNDNNVLSAGNAGAGLWL